MTLKETKAQLRPETTQTELCREARGGGGGGEERTLRCVVIIHTAVKIILQFFYQQSRLRALKDQNVNDKSDQTTICVSQV